jgi:hypothetical protein
MLGVEFLLLRRDTACSLTVADKIFTPPQGRYLCSLSRYNYPSGASCCLYSYTSPITEYRGSCSSYHHGPLLAT